MDQFKFAPINEETASKIIDFVDNVNQIIGEEYDTRIVQYDVNRLENNQEPLLYGFPPEDRPRARSHTPRYRPVIYQPVIIQSNSNQNVNIYRNDPGNITHDDHHRRRNVSNDILVNEGMNEDEKDKKKKTNKTTEYVIGAILISTVSVVSTWVITSDGYVKLWREGIDDKLNELEMFNLRNGNDDDVEKFVRSTKEWLNMLKKRKRSTFVSKIGLITSAMSMAASYLAGPTLLVGGILGCGISGCYYIWNQHDVSITKEKKQYSTAMSISLNIRSRALMQSNIQAPQHDIDTNINGDIGDNGNIQIEHNQYNIPQYNPEQYIPTQYVPPQYSMQNDLINLNNPNSDDLIKLT